MKKRYDGSIQSSNIPTKSNVRNSQNTDSRIYRALVVNVKFSDSIDNYSKNAKSPEIFYDVVILGGFRSGSLISNCKVMNPMGGSFDFYHRVLKASTLDISGTTLEEQDGDIVYVTFIQGNSDFPVIIGVETQSNSLDEDSKAPVADEGYIYKNQYNGVLEVINQFGEYTLTVKGEKEFDSDTGKLTINDEPSSYNGVIQIFKESMFIGNKTFSIFGTTESSFFELVVGLKTDGTKTFSEVISVQDERLTRTFASGLTITEDGAADKVTIETEGGTIITIDGQTGFINLKVNTTELIINGASGTISLLGEFVDLGNAVADLVVKYTELKSQYEAHFHMVPQAFAGVLPSQPPAVGLLPTAGSTKVRTS